MPSPNLNQAAEVYRGRVASRRTLSSRRLHRDEVSRPTKRVVASYDKRWTYTQWIKKDKDAFKLEYLFASSPTTNAAGAIADGTSGTNPLYGSADLAIQTVRAGVNFKF
jgi:hypothetical protein